MVGLLGKTLIELACSVREPLAQLGDKAGTAVGDAKPLAVCWQALLTFVPGHQEISIVCKGIRAGYAQVSAAQFPRHGGQYAQFQITPVCRRTLLGRAENQLAPALGSKADIDLDVDPFPMKRFVPENDFHCLQQGLGLGG